MTVPMTSLQRGLAILCGGLGLALLYELIAPLPAHSIPELRAPKTVVLPATPLPPAASPPDAFAAIGDRPLFDPARKKYVPPPTAAEQAAAAPPPPPNLALVGVILDNQTRLAIVRTPEAALASSLSIGASIGGWQLTAIEPDRIVLKAGAAESEIRLDANKASPSAAQKPPVMGQQGQSRTQNTP